MDLVRDKRVKDAMMNSTVQKMFERGELRKDHPLQRKPGRWNSSDKDGLIASVLKDEDIDSIKVCEQLTSNGVILWVIDGLQRLTTLSSYLNGGFKIGRNVEFPIVTYQSVKKDYEGNIVKDEYENYEYELIKYDLRGKFYNDLPVELQEKFNNYKIDMVKHLDCTDEEIGYHIRRYNKQKSMNASENAVTFMDNIAKEVKRISLNNKFFKNDCYKEIERKNGTIERIVTESIMCMFHLNDWKKQSKKMGEFLNKESSKAEFDKLNNNLKRLDDIYEEGFSDIFTSKDSFVWFTLFEGFTKLDIADSRFVDFLRCFKNNNLGDKQIDGESFNHIDKDKSTKDKSVIMKKIDILERLLNDFLYIEKKEEYTNLNDIESFIAKNVDMDIEEIHDDMDLYNESLDGLLENTVRLDSKLRNEANRSSLLAMMAYSYKVDQDLDEWMSEYAKKNDTYFIDQRKNFNSMLCSFNEYISLHNKEYRR